MLLLLSLYSAVKHQRLKCIQINKSYKHFAVHFPGVGYKIMIISHMLKSVR